MSSKNVLSFLSNVNPQTAAFAPWEPITLTIIFISLFFFSDWKSIKSAAA